MSSAAWPAPAASLSPAAGDAGGRLQDALCVAAAAIVPLHLSMFRVVARGVIVRPADLLSLLVLAGTLATLREPRRHLLRGDVALLALLCGYIVVQGLYLDNLRASLKEALQLALAVMTLVAIGVQVQRAPRLFLLAFAGALGASMLHALLSSFAIGRFVGYKLYGDGRYVFGLLAMVLLLMARQSRGRGPWPWLFVLSLPPLVASLERKGLLGVLCALAALAFLGLARGLQVRAGALLALVLAALLPLAAGLGGDAVEAWQRLWADNHFVDEAKALYTSNLHRSALLLNGLDIFAQHWLFGTGADSLRAAMRWYFADPHLANGTHNFYLDTAIKYGVVGAALMFGAMAFGVRAMVRSFAAGSPHALLALYLYFVVAFMSEGSTVTLMALLPAFSARLFDATGDRAPGSQP